jgi:hypothetical protein
VGCGEAIHEHHVTQSVVMGEMIVRRYADITCKMGGGGGGKPKPKMKEILHFFKKKKKKTIQK